MRSKPVAPAVKVSEPTESVVMSLDAVKEDKESEEKKVCLTCKTPNDPDALFCKSCAALL
jgi:ribosomal protein L40E